MTKVEIMAKISLKYKLLKIDFTENEATVYLALLDLAPCTAGPVISKTKLHRNVVYTSLDHLIGKKLVAEKLVGGRKHFALASPSILSAELEEKVSIAAEVSREILEVSKADFQEITVHQGNDEYLSLLTSIIKSLPKGSTKYVLGTGGEAFMRETMLPIWKKYHQVAQTQQLKIKMLGYESQRQAIESSTSREKLYETRYLPSNMENPAGLHIYPAAGIVLNIIYSNDQSPVTAIRIKNPALTQGYLNLFENLWGMGKY